jgi:hypothetical protein
VLVYATGFDAHAYKRPMKVTGFNATTIDEAWRDKIYSYGGIAVPGFPNLYMLYGPFAPANNVPVPLGLDQEIACIVRLIAEVRARRAVVAPTVAATEKFLTRLGAAFPGTVWVGGCKNWYTGDQNTPVLWPLPQHEHQAFFDEVSRGFSVHPFGLGRLIRHTEIHDAGGRDPRYIASLAEVGVCHIEMPATRSGDRIIFRLGSRGQRSVRNSPFRQFIGPDAYRAALIIQLGRALDLSEISDIQQAHLGQTELKARRGSIPLLASALLTSSLAQMSCRSLSSSRKAFSSSGTAIPSGDYPQAYPRVLARVR